MIFSTRNPILSSVVVAVAALTASSPFVSAGGGGGGGCTRQVTTTHDCRCTPGGATSTSADCSGGTSGNCNGFCIAHSAAVSHCSSSTSCTSCCRRRILKDELDVLHAPLVEGEWEAQQKTCGAYDYEVYLMVDSHLAMVAVPEAKAMKEGCEVLAFHAKDSVDGTNTIVKDVQVLQASETYHQPIERIVKDHAIQLTAKTYKFNDLVAAFDAADSNADGMVKRDIVTNNCGDFMKNLGKLLGIKATPQLTWKISRKLVSAGGFEFTDEVRESRNLSLVPSSSAAAAMTAVSGGGTSDEDLIYNLVEMRTKELY